MSDESEPQRLVRVLAFALRHHPRRFGVGLDGEGFADLNDLVVGIRFSHYDWAAVDRDRVVAAIRGTDPGQFEVRGGLVRARYGHSVVLGSPGERRTQPEALWHGTAAAAVATVLATGLRQMTRAFVHLTSDPDYAGHVAAAKGGGVVFHVGAKGAAASGVVFFQANSHVWLAQAVPPEHLSTSPGRDARAGGGDVVARCGRLMA